MKHFSRFSRPLFSLLLGALLFSIASPAMAQVISEAEMFGGGLTGQEFASLAGLGGGVTLPIVIARLIRTLLGFLGIVGVVLLIYAGVLWMTASGDPKQVERAQRILRQSLIGLAIVLSSFAIAHFVVSQLLGAIVGRQTTVTSPTNPGDYGDPPGLGNSFVVLSTNQSCSTLIRNIQPEVLFSRAPSAETLDSGLTLSRTGDPNPTPGSWRVLGRRALFIPEASCTPDYPDITCLDASTEYVIRFNPAVLRSADGRSLRCTTANPCDPIVFQTGLKVDREAPELSMTLPLNEQTVIGNAVEFLQTRAQDDAGVTSTVFFVNNEEVDEAGLEDSTAGVVDPDNYFNGEWDTSGYTTNQSYRLRASGLDCGGNEATSPSIAVMLRAPNCSNGVLDAELGETAIDCGGDSANPFYCGACDGDACSSALECSSSFCVDGNCVSLPVISQISPGDGAPGNFISILGSGFGVNPGIVRFLGDPAIATDDVDHAPSPACSTSWSDTQVVIELDADALDGPIQLITATQTSDRTDDALGPALNDFDVNQTVRPGLCAFTPPASSAQTVIRATGNNFGDAQEDTVLYFGSGYASGYPGNWTPTSFQATVPQVPSGRMWNQVFSGPIGNRQGSNRLSFTVNPSASQATAPEIFFVQTGIHLCENTVTVCATDADCAADVSCEEAAAGAAGQYVSIAGQGFGSARGTVRVNGRASPDDRSVATIDFPAACGEPIWRDDFILVKVPPTYSLQQSPRAIVPGVHDLSVVRASDGRSSNVVDFTVLGGQASASLCRVSPASGPPGTPVILYGERLGSNGGTVTFYENQTVRPSVWTQTLLQGSNAVPLTVPEGAETGPVVAIPTDRAASNPLAFSVGFCGQDFSCATGTSCCTDGACRADCGAVEVESHYAYAFSTGVLPIIPQVVSQCGAGVISPTPSLSFEGGDRVCSNAIVSATFTVPMDPMTLNPTTVLVERCTNAACSNAVPVEAGRMTISTTRYGEDTRFEWFPADVFVSGSRFRVTLQGGDTPTSIRGVDGTPLREDFTFEFFTSSSDTTCHVGSVLVSPSEFTATAENQTIAYSASPTAAEAACLLLNCINYTWQWTSSDPSRASILPSGSCRASATALRETQAGQPALLQATLVEQGRTGSGRLFINFADPAVSAVWPDCSEACVNATIGASFTVPMQDVFSRFDSEGNPMVQLFRCQDEGCTVGVEPVTGLSTTYDEATDWLSVSHPLLQPATFYRVVISGDATSTSGVPLGEDVTWTFETKADADVCGVDRVALEPSQVISRVIAPSSRTRFTAYAYGSPDSCSLSGQRLDSASLLWNTWGALDTPNRTPEADLVTLYGTTSPGEILLSSTLPNACSASLCLNTGSSSYLAVCGNSVREASEDCDDGNDISGDGCSAMCLTEGVGACSSTVTANCCGNGAVEGREECDDGDIVSGDGCSAQCVNEGSAALSRTFGRVVCGNGSVADFGDEGGEECDDGNGRGGDGCSAQCLHEGSTPERSITSRCGNGGTPEIGESCDDGNLTNGDGCSSSCVHEGSSLSYGSVCGDRLIGVGEDCDDGGREAGDGCSARCLFEGSSHLYPRLSICADGLLGTGESCEAPSVGTRVAPFAVTEFTSSAVLEVLESPDNQATSTITASTGAHEGEATVTLACACSGDLSCGDVDVLGCGTANCCFERPTIREVQPPIGATNVCRNTALSMSFSQPMNADSVGEHIHLELTAIAGVPVTSSTCTSRPGHTWVLASDSDRHMFARIWVQVRERVSEFFGRPAAQASPVCRVPAALTVEPSTPGSRIRIGLSTPLEARGTYILVADGDNALEDLVSEGVMSVSDVTLASTFTSSFTVGTDICAIAGVELVDEGHTLLSSFDHPSSGYFSAAGEEHTLRATAYALQGSTQVEIQPIAGVYTWSWSGSTATPPLTWGWGSTIPPEGDAITVAPSTTPSTTATATGQNGQEVASAELHIDVDAITTPSSAGRIVRGEVDLTAFMCENPWPEVGAFPFEDSSAFVSRADESNLTAPFTHFSFLYCRDAGGPGTSDDLPALTVVEAPRSPIADVLKEILFLVQGTDDALGVRVLPNAAYATPVDWYASRNFRGSPSTTSLDGYAAVQDGRTLYVSAPNIASEGGLPVPRAYPNIYVLSVSESATAATQTIWNQILETWRFNANTDLVSDMNACKPFEASPQYLSREGDYIACEADRDCGYRVDEEEGYVFCDPTEDPSCSQGFCDAEKGKLRRDLTRLTDARIISTMLAEYGNTNRHCSVTRNQACRSSAECPGSETCRADIPTLPAGSFLPNFTTSLWPSWTSVLGNALEQALPVDPLNSWSPACPAGANPATCFTAASGTFVCPENSHAYIFQSSGGESYTLSVQLESYDHHLWSAPLDPTPTDPPGDIVELVAEHAGYFSPPGFVMDEYYCHGMPLGLSSACGDGVIGVQDNPATPALELEPCEIGDVSSASCPTGVMPVRCVNDDGVCRFQTIAEATLEGAECVPFRCGNGVQELSEECDDGANNGRYGFCGADCTLETAFSCGDGFLAGGEQCDCGTAANFSSLLSNPNSWATLNRCGGPNGQYASTSTGGASCAFDCTTPGPSCGDGVQNGPEQCDGETENWSGRLCHFGVNHLDPCSTDVDCPGGTCGFSTTGLYIACGSSRICEGGIDAGRPCTTNANCDVTAPGDADGVCSSATYPLSRTRTCTNACVWPTSPPWNTIDTYMCVGASACGNGEVEGSEICDDGNTSNTDACTNTCQTNTCGDGFLQIGVEACDAGPLNGVPCSPSYDAACSSCSTSCRITATSGAYCGDGVIQTGEEFCDGTTLPRMCFHSSTNFEDREAGNTCVTNADCASGLTCQTVVGVCNGGVGNGAPCVVGSTDLRFSCGPGGSCVTPVCGDSCTLACPFGFTSERVLAAPEPGDRAPAASVALYSYLSSNEPDTATLFIPACTAATRLSVDVDMSDVTPPSVDILFVTDLSGSMDWPLASGGPPRVSIAAQVISEAIQELFDSYDADPTRLRIGAVSFTRGEAVDGPDEESDAAGFDANGDGVVNNDDACIVGTDVDRSLAWLDHPFVTASGQSSLLYNTDSGVLTTYNTGRTDSGTPIAPGVSCALTQFEDSRADRKIIILLSDGAPSAYFDGASISEDSATRLTAEWLQDNVPEDVEMYTATLTDNTAANEHLVGYMKHFSSDTCVSATDTETPSNPYDSIGELEDPDLCGPTDGIEYAYSADTAEGLSGVYQNIINSILGLNVTLTTFEADGDPLTSVVSLQEGIGLSLPLPEGFACPLDGSPWTIPLRFTFTGEGQARLSAMQLTYCPAP